MKRKLLTIILMVTLSITLLTACGHEDNNKENKEKMLFNNFIVEEELNTHWYSIDSYIVYDKKTKVKYFLYGDCCSDKSGITPLYNADGTLQIHED